MLGTSGVAEASGVNVGRVEGGGRLDREPALAERGLDGGLDDDPAGCVDAEQHIDQTSLRVHLVNQSLVDRLVALVDLRVGAWQESRKGGVIVEGFFEPVEVVVERLGAVE